MYVCILCVCMYAPMYVYMYVCMYVCVCVCVCMCMYVCMYVCVCMSCMYVWYGSERLALFGVLVYFKWVEDAGRPQSVERKKTGAPQALKLVP